MEVNNCGPDSGFGSSTSSLSSSSSSSSKSSSGFSMGLCQTQRPYHDKTLQLRWLVTVSRSLLLDGKIPPSFLQLMLQL